jgi:signal transduction histidine kinase
LGGGERGAFMRLFDWSKTSLGAVECWSPALRSRTEVWPVAEETHWKIACTPVPDETAPNAISGVAALAHEIAEKVVGERRMVRLRELGAGAIREGCSVRFDLPDGQRWRARSPCGDGWGGSGSIGEPRCRRPGGHKRRRAGLALFRGDSRCRRPPGQAFARRELSPELRASCGDAVQLQQVMVNLIMNAVEATSARSAGPRQVGVISLNLRSDEIPVMVRDSAVGLDPNNLRDIFKPFVSSKAGGWRWGSIPRRPA